MKTLVFCTSYADSLAAWQQRVGRWVVAVRAGGLRFDRMLIVDDGSPVLPDWPDFAVTAPDAGSEARFCLHRFADRRGRDVGGEPFPGWYRSFAHAVLYGIASGFDRIVHLEGDAFLISDRAVSYFNTCDRGWVALWCPLHGFPETTLQIINGDQFAQARAVFAQPYAAHLAPPERVIEHRLPFTRVERALIGDRYGERGNTVPFGADYVSQVAVDQPPDYFWWSKQDGSRLAATDRPATGDLAAHYRRDDTGHVHGGAHFRRFLQFLDRQLCPSAYLEIGPGQGAETVSCDALCVDPRLVATPEMTGARTRTLLFQMQPDAFFAAHDPRQLLAPPDLAFLDGLHHFEQVLRDFINVERHSHAGSLVLLHDMLPLNTRMTGRTPAPAAELEPPATRGFWTGDVWRLLPILLEFRPELEITVLDCPPTGLVLCSGLDSRSTTLMYNYDRIVARFADVALENFGLDHLWSLVPVLSSHKVLAAPRIFCERFRFHR